MGTTTDIRFDGGTLRDDRREELIAWIRDLGIDPEDVKSVGLIRMAEQSYELHLSKFVRLETGHIQQDWARDESVTEPLIIPLGTAKSWPAWLGAAA